MNPPQVYMCSYVKFKNKIKLKKKKENRLMDMGRGKERVLCVYVRDIWKE